MKKNIIAIKIYSLLVFDFLVFVLLLPLIISLVFVLYSTRKIRKRKTVFFAGLEHIINKTAWRGKFFDDKEFATNYFSFEKTDRTLPNLDRKRVIKSNRFFSIDIVVFMIYCIKLRPLYLELYFEGIGIHQVLYALAARLNNILSVSILRGELYNSEKKSKMQNYFRLNAWKITDYIFYREIYMVDYFSILGIEEKRTFFDPNKVFVEENVIYERDSQNILFLNGIKKWRNIHLLIESIPFVLENHPQAHFTIVGCRNKDEFNYVLELVVKHNVSKNTSIHYWAKDPKPYYNKASVFILPADLIFCNISLIESMERGVPAIVADVEDADKIIKHKKNGFLAKKEPEDIAKYISILLSDENLRIQLGRESRNTIVNDYNDKDRMTPILNLLRNKYPESISKTE